VKFQFEPNSILVVGGILSLMMGLMLLVQATQLKAYARALGAMCLCLLSGAAAIFLALDERGATYSEFKLAANCFGSLAYIGALACFTDLYRPDDKQRAAMAATVLLLIGAFVLTDMKTSYLFNQSIRIALLTYCSYIIFIARDPYARALRWFSLATIVLSVIGLIPQLIFVISHTSDEVQMHIASGNNATLYQALVWAISPSIAYTCVTSVIYARISQQLRQSVYFDMLTGAHSRRYLIEEGHKVVERRRAFLPAGATSLLMIDIDHFKKINDSWGHTVGDAVLQHCVSCMMNNVRATDAIVGRYGGEEFCVVLPNTPMAGAGLVAERLREHIAQTPYMHEGQAIAITISVGIALQEKSSSFSNLVSLADQRLYLAKKTGRNKIVDWGDKMTPILQA
jgi:diguanylate cyclase (GGDEF)-like protein